MAKTEKIDFHGLEAVRLEAPNGASAVITCHGAQVVSWIPAQGGDRLFLSEQADYSPNGAIRGGIPVLFPQFGLRGPLQKHGFVRNMDWTLVDARHQDSYACASFRLESSAATRELWDRDFLAELTVMIERNRIDIELEITNTGAQVMEFTAGLHTYFSTGNVEMARLVGLEEVHYLDALNDLKRVTDTPEVLFVDDALDRVYLNATKPLLLSEPARHVAIEQEGFRDVVVWNPWESGIGNFSDLGSKDYKRFLCVEAAAFERPVIVAPGEDWVGRQTMVALPPGGLQG